MQVPPKRMDMVISGGVTDHCICLSVCISLCHSINDRIPNSGGRSPFLPLLDSPSPRAAAYSSRQKRAVRGGRYWQSRTQQKRPVFTPRSPGSDSVDLVGAPRQPHVGSEAKARADRDPAVMVVCGPRSRSRRMGTPRDCSSRRRWDSYQERIPLGTPGPTDAAAASDRLGTQADAQRFYF